jgi:hypothetical protein
MKNNFPDSDFKKKLETLVKAYISRNASADVSNELKKTAVNPAFFINMDFLSEDSSLKKDAITVFDTLEAVSNGMTYDNCTEVLSGIDETAVFYEWSRIIRAAEAFYANNYKKMHQELSCINENSFLSNIKKNLAEAADGSAEISDPEFINAITEKNTLINELYENLNECQSYSMEDLFTENALFLITEVLKTDKYSAEIISLKILNQLIDKDMSISRFTERLKLLLSPASVYKIISAAFFKTDKTISYIYYLKMILEQIKYGTAENKIKKYFNTAVLFLPLFLKEVSLLDVKEADQLKANAENIHDQIIKELDQTGKYSGLLEFSDKFKYSSIEGNPAEAETEDIKIAVNQNTVPLKNIKKQNADRLQLELF